MTGISWAARFSTSSQPRSQSVSNAALSRYSYALNAALQICEDVRSGVCVIGSDQLRRRLIEVITQSSDHRQAAMFLARTLPESARPDLELALGLVDMSGACDLAQSLPQSGWTIGKYTLHEYLGGGSFGEVWKARDAELECWVALKLIPVPSQATQQDLDRLRDEARAASAIRHPYVAGIRTAWVDHDRGFFVIDMQLCGDAAPEPDDPTAIAVASPLDKVWVPPEVPSRADAQAIAHFMIAIAAGVSAAHQRGVVHGDLKPANVLVSPNSGEPTVTDFGLARISQQNTSPSESQSDIPQGTPAYLAPEQAAGKSATVSSDVYALGALLHWLMAGQPPVNPTQFNESPLAQVQDVLAQLRDPGFLPTPVPSTWPETLRRISGRAMSKSAEDRHPTAESFATDLRAWLEIRIPPFTGPVTPIEPVTLWYKRNRKAIIIGTCAAAAILWIVIFLTSQYNQTQQAFSLASKAVASGDADEQKKRTSRKELAKDLRALVANQSGTRQDRITAIHQGINVFQFRGDRDLQLEFARVLAQLQGGSVWPTQLVDALYESHRHEELATFLSEHSQPPADMQWQVDKYSAYLAHDSGDLDLAVSRYESLGLPWEHVLALCDLGIDRDYTIDLGEPGGGPSAVAFWYSVRGYSRQLHAAISHDLNALRESLNDYEHAAVMNASVNGGQDVVAQYQISAVLAKCALGSYQNLEPSLQHVADLIAKTTSPTPLVVRQGAAIALRNQAALASYAGYHEVSDRIFEATLKIDVEPFCAAHTLLRQAEVALRTGNAAAARHLASLARQRLGENPPPFTRGGLAAMYWCEGVAAAIQGEWAAAQACLHQAVGLRNQITESPEWLVNVNRDLLAGLSLPPAERSTTISSIRNLLVSRLGENHPRIGELDRLAQSSQQSRN